MYQGLIAIRKTSYACDSKKPDFSTADEMLYPENLTLPYPTLMSYVAVGARSVENQQHRLVASGMRRTGRHEEPDQRRTHPSC